MADLSTFKRWWHGHAIWVAFALIIVVGAGAFAQGRSLDHNECIDVQRVTAVTTQNDEQLRDAVQAQVDLQRAVLASRGLHRGLVHHALVAEHAILGQVEYLPPVDCS